MRQSEVFVFLDTVKFSESSFDNRNRILANGKDKWLTIPLRHQSGVTDLEMQEFDPSWREKHLIWLKYAYHEAPFFDVVYPIIEDYYKQTEGMTSLADICWTMLPFFMEAFDISCEVKRTSEMQITGKGSELVLNICKELKADEYYSGPMGKDYLQEDRFTEAGIKVIYQDFQPPHHLSAIHQLFTVGPIL